jgi:uncharacterized paraquat-inducible protein A
MPSTYHTLRQAADGYVAQAIATHFAGIDLERLQAREAARKTHESQGLETCIYCHGGHDPQEWQRTNACPHCGETINPFIAG